MNLFSVKNTQTKKVVIRYKGSPAVGSPAYFPNKQEAKEFRDELNRIDAHRTCHVSLGPDHRHYNCATALDWRI